MVFKISNDSIMICRYPSDTAPWDLAMDRGNPADLTAFVLADRASFLCEGTSLQWVRMRNTLCEQMFSASPPKKGAGNGPLFTTRASIPSQLCRQKKRGFTPAATANTNRAARAVSQLI